MSAPVFPDQSRRLLVRSCHGVSIAVWEEGDGPPMVLVHGSLGDHTAWAVSVAELRKYFTTFAVDRRGFGASEDGDSYAIGRDFEGAIDAAEAALAEGDRETAVVRMLVDALEMASEQVEAVRRGPRWPNLLAGAHSGPRECRVEEARKYEPGQFIDITAPTLMLSGGDSPGPLVEATQKAAAAIPDAEVRVLEGHAHFAHRTDPEMVV